MSLIDDIHAAEVKGGRPIGRLENWQKELLPGDYVLFPIPLPKDANPATGYMTISKPPEQIPFEYLYGIVNAKGIYTDQELVLPRLVTTYPITLSQYELAESHGFPTKTSFINLLIGFHAGGLA